MENMIEVKGIIKKIENIKDTNYKKITLLMPKSIRCKFEKKDVVEDSFLSFLMFNSAILEGRELQINDDVCIEGKLIKNSDMTGTNTNCEIKIDPKDVFVYQRYREEDDYGF